MSIDKNKSKPGHERKLYREQLVRYQISLLLEAVSWQEKFFLSRRDH